MAILYLFGYLLLTRNLNCGGYNMKDKQFLMWLHERLEHKHEENPLVDYMHKLRAIIAATPDFQDSSLAQGCNSLKELERRMAMRKQALGRGLIKPVKCSTTAHLNGDTMNRFQGEVHERLQKSFNSGNSHIMLIGWYNDNDNTTYRWLKKVAEKNKCTFKTESAEDGRHTIVTFTRKSPINKLRVAIPKNYFFHSVSGDTIKFIHHNLDSTITQSLEGSWQYQANDGFVITLTREV